MQDFEVNSSTVLRRDLEALYRKKEIDLRARLERAEYTVAELNVRLKEEREEKDNLNVKLQLSEGELRRDRLENQELQRVLILTRHMLHELTNENKLEVDVTAFKDEIHDLNEEILVYQNEIAQKDDMLKSELELQFEDYRQELLRMQGKNQELSSKVEGLNNYIELQEQRLREQFEKELIQARKRVQELESVVGSTDSELKYFEEREKENIELRQQLEILQNKAKVITDEAEAHVRNIESEKEALKESFEKQELSLRQDLDTLMKENEMKELERQETEEKMLSIQADLIEKEQEARFLETECISLKEKLADSDLRISAMESKIESTEEASKSKIEKLLKNWNASKAEVQKTQDSFDIFAKQLQEQHEYAAKELKEKEKFIEDKTFRLGQLIETIDFATREEVTEDSIAKMFELRLQALHEHHMLELEMVKLQHDIKLEKAAESMDQVRVEIEKDVSIYTSERDQARLDLLNMETEMYIQRQKNEDDLDDLKKMNLILEYKNHQLQKTVEVISEQQVRLTEREGVNAIRTETEKRELRAMYARESRWLEDRQRYLQREVQELRERLKRNTWARLKDPTESERKLAETISFLEGKVESSDEIIWNYQRELKEVRRTFRLLLSDLTDNVRGENQGLLDENEKLKVRLDQKILFYEKQMSDFQRDAEHHRDMAEMANSRREQYAQNMERKVKELEERNAKIVRELENTKRSVRDSMVKMYGSVNANVQSFYEKELEKQSLSIMELENKLKKQNEEMVIQDEIKYTQMFNQSQRSFEQLDFLKSDRMQLVAEVEELKKQLSELKRDRIVSKGEGVRDEEKLRFRLDAQAFFDHMASTINLEKNKCEQKIKREKMQSSDSEMEKKELQKQLENALTQVQLVKLQLKNQKDKTSKAEAKYHEMESSYQVDSHGMLEQLESKNTSITRLKRRVKQQKDENVLKQQELERVIYMNEVEKRNVQQLKDRLFELEKDLQLDKERIDEERKELVMLKAKVEYETKLEADLKQKILHEHSELLVAKAKEQLDVHRKDRIDQLAQELELTKFDCDGKIEKMKQTHRKVLSDMEHSLTLTLLGTETVVKRAEEQLREAKRQYASDMDENDRLIQSLEKTLRQKTLALRRQEKKRNELENKITNLEIEVVSKSEEIESVQNENDLLKHKFQNKMRFENNYFNQHQHIIESLAKQLSKTRRMMIHSYGYNLSNVEIQLNEQITDMESDALALRQQLATTQLELQNESVKWESKIDQMKQTHIQEKVMLSEQIALLEREAKKAQNSLRQKYEEKETKLDEDYLIAKKDLEIRFVRRNEHLEKSVEMLEKEIEELHSKLSEGRLLVLKEVSKRYDPHLVGEKDSQLAHMKEEYELHIQRFMKNKDEMIAELRRAIVRQKKATEDQEEQYKGDLNALQNEFNLRIQQSNRAREELQMRHAETKDQLQAMVRELQLQRERFETEREKLQINTEYSMNEVTLEVQEAKGVSESLDQRLQYERDKFDMQRIQLETRNERLERKNMLLMNDIDRIHREKDTAEANYKLKLAQVYRLQEEVNLVQCQEKKYANLLKNELAKEKILKEQLTKERVYYRDLISDLRKTMKSLRKRNLDSFEMVLTAKEQIEIIVKAQQNGEEISKRDLQDAQIAMANFQKAGMLELEREVHRLSERLEVQVEMNQKSKMSFDEELMEKKREAAEIVTSMEIQLSELQQEVQQRVERINHLEKTVTELNSKSQFLEQNMNDHVGTLYHGDSDSDSGSGAEIGYLTEWNEQLREKNFSLRDQLYNTRKEFRKRLGRFYSDDGDFPGGMLSEVDLEKMGSEIKQQRASFELTNRQLEAEKLRFISAQKKWSREKSQMMEHFSLQKADLENALEECKNDLRNVKNRLVTQTNETSTYCDNIQRSREVEQKGLRDEMDRLRTRMHSQDIEINKLQVHLREERFRLKQLIDQRHADIDLEVDVRYKNQVDTLNAHREQLQQVLDDHAVKVEQLQHELETEQAKNAQMISHYDAVIRDKNRELDLRNQQLSLKDEVDMAFEDMKERFETAKSEIERLREDWQATISDRDDFRDKYQSLVKKEAEMHEAKVHATSLEVKIKELNQEIEKLNLSCRNLAQERIKAEREMLEAQRKLTAAQVKTSAVDERLQEAEKEYLRELEILRRQLTEEWMKVASNAREEAMETLDEMTHSFDEEREELIDKLEMCKDKLETEISRRGKLKSELKDHRKRLKEVQRKLSAYKRQLKRDRDSHGALLVAIEEERQNERMNLENDVSELQADVDELNEMVVELELETKQKDGDISDLKIQWKEATDKLETIRDQNKKLQSLLEDEKRKNEVGKAKSQKDHDNVIKVTSETIDNQKDTINGLHNDINDLRDRLDAQTRIADEKTLQYNEVLADLKAHKADAADHKLRMDITHRENMELRAEMREYKDFKNNHEERMDKKNQLLYNEIALLKSEVATLQPAYKKSRQKVKAQSTECFELKQEIARLQAMRDRATEMEILLNRKDADVQTMETSLAREKNLTRQLEEDLRVMKMDMDALNRENEQLNRERLDALRSREQSERRASDFQRASEKVHQQNYSLNNAIGEFQSDMKKRRNEVDVWKLQVQELQAKLVHTESDHSKMKRLISRLRVEKTDLHNQLIECQGVIHKLAKLGNVGAEQLQKVMMNVKAGNLVQKLETDLAAERAQTKQLKTALELLREQVSQRKKHNQTAMGAGGADFDQAQRRIKKLDKLVKNLRNEDNLYNANLVLKTIRKLEEELQNTNVELNSLKMSYTSAINRVKSLEKALSRSHYKDETRVGKINSLKASNEWYEKKQEKNRKRTAFQEKLHRKLRDHISTLEQKCLDIGKQSVEKSASLRQAQNEVTNLRNLLLSHQVSSNVAKRLDNIRTGTSLSTRRA